jgi:hypothetical protein
MDTFVSPDAGRDDAEATLSPASLLSLLDFFSISISSISIELTTFKLVSGVRRLCIMFTYTVSAYIGQFRIGEILKRSDEDAAVRESYVP